MKVHLADDGKLLIIEGEDMLEKMALKGWQADFFDGEAEFRIGELEGFQRAEEDVV